MDTASKLEVVAAPALAAAPSSARLSAAERAAERLAKAQAQLKAAKHDKRAAAERIAAIAGRAFLAEAARSPDFRRQAAEILRRTVTKPAERVELAGWLIEVTP
jgi:hypothetical protein